MSADKSVHTSGTPANGSVRAGGDRQAIAEEGEPDRAFLGIDGTMGDAQDEPHPFLGSVYGAHCRVCGLARPYRMHADA